MNTDGMTRPRPWLILVLLLMVSPCPGRAEKGPFGPGRQYADAAGPRPRPVFSVNLQYPNVVEDWRFDARSPMTSAPAVADGRVFAGDGAGKLRALSLDSGAVAWAITAGGPIRSTPAVDARRVVFSSADGSLCALKASNGKKLWQFKSEGASLGSPCLTNNMVYIGAGDGKFRALGLEDGALVWECPGIGAPVETRPLVCEDRVIFGAKDGYLYALGETTGLLLWKWKGDPGATQSPEAVCSVAAKPRLFVAAPDRLLAALDLATGKELWRTDAWPVGGSIGLAEDGSLCYAGTMTNGTILSFTAAADHAAKVWEWDAPPDGGISSAMLAEKNGVLYSGTRDGLLLAIDPRSGTLLWEHKLGTAALNTAAPLDDINEVVVSDTSGRITRIGPRQH